MIIPGSLSAAQARTARFEGGLVRNPYWDAKGKCWTAGIGCTGDLLTQTGSIGPDTSLTDAQWIAEFLARWAKAETQAAIDLGAAYWAALDDSRRAVLIDIAFQQGGGNAETGKGGLAGYHRMLGAVRVHDWITARLECLDSAADKETPTRCEANAEVLKTGAFPA